MVTDGDKIAQRAVEKAAKNIGGRCISCSAGNPTMLIGKEIVEQIKKTPHDPVVVMVDDCGGDGPGYGEKAMLEIIKHVDIETLGVVAVASNSKDKGHVRVDYSIDCEGNKIFNAVDKFGKDAQKQEINGDTLSILNDIKVPLIIGLGDPGKMDGKDDIQLGAPIMTAALKEVINNSL